MVRLHYAPPGFLERNMADIQTKSFRLRRPACPHCGARTTRVDHAVFANLWRLPLVLVTALVFYPAVGIYHRCRICGRRFLAQRKA
jgi:hypothetical protein